MKLPITIEYNNGEVATYIANPPEWAKWERESKKSISDVKDGVGVWDLLFLAYHAYKRENAGKPVKPFDIWCETVSDILTGDEDPKVTSAEV